MDRSKRFTLFAFPDRPAHSNTNSASPGSILARQQLRAKTKSLTFPPLSIARYSFIQLGEQGRQWRERKYPTFETVPKGDSNPGSLDCESGILPLSYRAPQTISNDCDNPNPPCVNNMVIFTDSQSAIHAIAQMQHHKQRLQPIITDIGLLTTANMLHNHNDVETSIQWIPGRCEQVSFATYKQIIQTKPLKSWHDRLARCNTGRTYYQHQQTPNQTDTINQLYRAHQNAIFHLRTHHAPLNANLHHIKKDHSAKCVYCPDSDATVVHFLFHCPLYDNIRSRLLPAQPNTQHALWIHYTTETNSYLQYVSHEQT